MILCDLMMPEMTGMDLYDELAPRAPAQAERIIFMTGGAFTAARAEFLDAVPTSASRSRSMPQHLSALIHDRLR